MTTPLDNKTAVWHWTGSSLKEQTVQDLANMLVTWAPRVSQVWVKTSDGKDWQGKFDDDPDFAVNGPTEIAKWVRILGSYGLEFHAWAVVKGKDVNEEADRVIAACNVSGVRSMILDVEPYAGFWTVGKDPIKPLMTRIRAGVGPDFHIGMAVDPRPQHYASIFPAEWKPFINSVHLQLYWNTFGRPYKDVLNEGFSTWRNYGLPLFPVFPGSAPRAEAIAGRDFAITEHDAKGASWWRLGVIKIPTLTELGTVYDYGPGGFDAPVGTAAERRGATLWPGKWFDVNPYLTYYSLGYHTGADLNLNDPKWDSDAHAPVYAIGRGVAAGDTTTPGCAAPGADV